MFVFALSKVPNFLVRKNLLKRLKGHVEYLNVYSINSLAGTFTFWFCIISVDPLNFV